MRRSNRLRTAVLTTTVVVIGSVLVFRWRVAREWNLMLRTADAMRTELTARDPHRPVLGGTATAGEAWTDYQLGIVEIAANTDAEIAGLVQLGRRGKTEAYRAQLDQLLDTHEPALAYVRRGAGRRTARYPGWANGVHQRGLHLLKVRALVSLTVLRAEKLRQGGHTTAAVDATLDALQFAGDVMRTPTPSADLSFRDVLGLNSRHAGFLASMLDVPRPDLHRLATGLRILDASLPLGSPALALEFVRYAQTARLPNGTDYFCKNSYPQWRALGFVFSDRLIVADHLLRSAAIAAKLGPLTHGPWSELQTAHDARVAQSAHQNVELRASFQRPAPGDRQAAPVPHGGRVPLHRHRDAPRRPVRWHPESRDRGRHPPPVERRLSAPTDEPGSTGGTDRRARRESEVTERDGVR